MPKQIKHPKVVVGGAGSLFFGRQAIWQMIHSPHLNTGTLALVDTNPERLEKLAKLAEMVAADAGVPLAVEASTERKDVFQDADFVVLSFADRTVHFRGLDCQISARYGVRMCSGDIIGPGGVFRAMREFPVILECVRDIESLCPDAWVINYINPTAAHGIGLRRYAPNVKSFALCDSLHMPHVKRGYTHRAGIVDDEYTKEIAQRFDLRIAGVNHFTWILRAQYEGMISSIADADAIVRELLEAERDTLPGCWYS
jgi:alpha-galactosidase/6-phospho-beta-glucosidase family protein